MPITEQMVVEFLTKLKRQKEEFEHAKAGYQNQCRLTERVLIEHEKTTGFIVHESGLFSIGDNSFALVEVKKRNAEGDPVNFTIKFLSPANTR